MRQYTALRCFRRLLLVFLPRIPRRTPTRHRPVRRSLISCFGLALAVAMPSRPVLAQRSVDPYLFPGSTYGRFDAAATVDRFVRALNRRDTVELAALFDSDAVVGSFDPRNETFAAEHWLPHPWQYHLIPVLSDLGADSSGPTASFGRDAELTVLSRITVGSEVTDLERLRYKSPDGDVGRQTWLVTYDVWGGRIHDIILGNYQNDLTGVPHVAHPAYPPATGPVVAMDTHHFNFNTPMGSYFDFAELLRRDGYRVRTLDVAAEGPVLDSIDVLVISDALPPDSDSASAAGPRSAFTPAEIAALRTWVSAGGALLLIADHNPWGGAAAALANVFGASFHNGAVRSARGGRANSGNIEFTRGAGTLRSHPITDGLNGGTRVDSVETFLGQAFPPSDALQPLLVLPNDAILTTPSGEELHVGGWLQGAVRRFGKGSVGLFGEAWMFRVGEFMGHRSSTQNPQFILDLFRWLTQQAAAEQAKSRSR